MVAHWSPLGARLPHGSKSKLHLAFPACVNVPAYADLTSMGMELDGVIDPASWKIVMRALMWP